MAIVLLAVWTLADIPLKPWLKASSDPTRRIAAYIATMVVLTVVGGIALSVTPQERLWNPFTGVYQPSTTGRLAAGFPMILVACLAIGVALIARFRPTVREKAADALEPMAYLLPETRVERTWFVPLCLFAGFWEEVICRGFLPFYFAHAPYGLPVPFATLAAALLFGLLHAYQGIAGILSTLVTAILFSLLAFSAGSLWPGIALHTLIDLRVLAFIPKIESSSTNPAR